MLDRRYALFILLLVSDGNENHLTAQEPAVQMQVYDYAGLSPESVYRVLQLTQQILSEAGVSVRADLCRGGTRAPCGTESDGTRRLVIRIIASVPKTEDSVLRPSLARSIADHHGGTYTSIFLQRVQDAAAEANIPRNTVLAYAAAHEVGHLLLGADAHTPQGLMKADWGRAEYESMNQHHLYFSKQQTQELASRYGERSTATPIDAAER